MTLEECLEAHKKSKTVIGESTTIYNKGKGVSREVSFVPKDSKKKADGVTTGDHSSSSKWKDHERKKTQNELYRLTFCENILKIALGTQPQRPQLGSEGFPGRIVFWRSGGRPGKNDVMRCCVVVDLVFLVFDTGVVRAVAGLCTLSDC